MARQPFVQLVANEIITHLISIKISLYYIYSRLVDIDN